MDAYLAAFAVTDDMRQATFDQGFKTFDDLRLALVTFWPSRAPAAKPAPPA